MRKKKGSGLTVRTTVLLGLSVGCLTFSAVGSTRAALSYYSETYSARIDMQSIGITLVENDRDVSYRDYTHADDEWDEATGTLFTGALRHTDFAFRSRLIGSGIAQSARRGDGESWREA